MNTARAKELRQGRELRQLFELSDLLVEDKPLDVLLSVIVTALADVFARAAGGALPALPRDPVDGRLEIVRSAGDPSPRSSCATCCPSPGYRRPEAQPRSGRPSRSRPHRGRPPVGLARAVGETAATHEREPLLLFANQIALAVERAQLARAGTADAADRGNGAPGEDARRRGRPRPAGAAGLDQGLVVHLVRHGARDQPGCAAEPGRPHRRPGRPPRRPRAEPARHEPDPGGRAASPAARSPARKLVSAVVTDLPPALARTRRCRSMLPDDLPPIDADLVLMSRVLANLVENAVRHGPKDTPIPIRAAASRAGGRSSCP